MGKPRTEIEERFADGRALERAMQRATRRVLWEHKQLGYPIYALKDGRMQWIPPDEIDVQKPDDAPAPAV